jgi:hypothetical protein
MVINLHESENVRISSIRLILRLIIRQSLDNGTDKHYINVLWCGDLRPSPTYSTFSTSSQKGVRTIKPRELVFSGLVLLVLLSASALASRSLRASPPIGAVVQTWHYDPQAHTVTVRIVNVSQKNITAFNLSLKITYPSGVSEYEWRRDLLNDAVVLDRFKGTPNEQQVVKEFGNKASFAAGGSYGEQIPVQTGLKEFEAILDVVAYSDKTAEATNAVALQALIEQRKATTASIRTANEIIRNVVGDSAVTAPHVVAAERVQKLLDTWKATRHYDVLDMNSSQLSSIVHDLKQTPPDQLLAYVAAKEKERATWADQAQFVKVGGQQ